jgi:hypothetical protein
MNIIEKLNYSLELFVVFFLAALLLFNGTLFEVQMPYATVVNYNSYVWQLILLLMVIAAAAWSKYVGVLVAALYLLYVLDMDTLITPID